MRLKTSLSISLLGGSIAALLLVSNMNPKENSAFPPIGIIVDMPESNPEKLWSRMQLLIAGGANPRDINVEVTTRTHPDNFEVIYQYPYVISISTSTATDKATLEKNPKIKGKRFIYAIE